jgi:hypothetical protein
MVAKEVLAEIGNCCAARLKAGGYFSEKEAEDVQSAYIESLDFYYGSGNPCGDFLVFAAELHSVRQGSNTEQELVRMQKMLRWSLSDRVRYWSFGALPGASDALYCHCVSTRMPCDYLGCPGVLSGDANIVHLVSVNPLAALVAGAWVRQELSAIAGGEAPFVFPMMVDVSTWQSLLQRHFGEL